MNIPTPSADWSGMSPDPASSPNPYRIYNIGNNNWVELEHYISVLEGQLGKKAVRNYLDMQPGDVPATYADVAELQRDAGFVPSTPLETVLGRFVRWYREYYGSKR
jgi:UDP-glucuronate 4-epimerase